MTRPPMTPDRLRAVRDMALRLATVAPPGPLADAARHAADTLADMLDPTTPADMLPVLADLLEGHALQIHDELEKTR